MVDDSAGNYAKSVEDKYTTTTLVYNTNTDNPDLSKGYSLLAENKLVEGRALLSRILRTDLSLSEDQQRTIRTRLAKVNDILVFSKDIYPNDPLVGIHITKRNSIYYSTIARKYKITHELLIMRLIRSRHVNLITI